MERIREFATSPKNVRFKDLELLLDNHIRLLFPDYNHHGSAHHTFTLGGRTFNIAKPHRGFVKKPYIANFLEAMEAVGLFVSGEEENHEHSQ